MPSRAWKRVILIALLVSITIPVSLLLFASHHRGSGAARGGSGASCAVIDGLYEAYPNNSLVKLISSILSRSGCRDVEVFLARNASLSVFRRLTHYSLIVMRVHGGYMGSAWKTGGLFTGVPWSSKYIGLARKGLVAEGVPFYVPPQGPKSFVALLPKFFQEEVKGRFPPGSAIVAGGCFTALDPSIPRALCRKGLWLYVGFEGSVKLSVLDKLLPVIVSDVIRARAGNKTALKELEDINGVKVFQCNSR